MAWQNPDGLQVKFGADYRTVVTNRARDVIDLGGKKMIAVDFDLSKIPAATTSFSSDLNNDGTVDGFHNGDVHLPAGSSVTEAVIVMTVAAAGGTSITVGTYQLAGTTISANSLVTATEGVLANLNAVGKRVFGAGALVATTAGTAGVGNSHDAFIGITTAGTFTAGKGRLLITYIDPTPDAAATFA